MSETDSNTPMHGKRHHKCVDKNRTSAFTHQSKTMQPLSTIRLPNEKNKLNEDNKLTTTFWLLPDGELFILAFTADFHAGIYENQAWYMTYCSE